MIWIVEDDPQIGLLIEMTVRKAGYAVKRMPDAETLDRVLEQREELPDLLLLDLMLRRKNGYDVLREWKNRASTAHVPVIIISARSAEHDKVNGLELGAEDYITKPFGVRELQARIRTALRRIPAAPEKLSSGGCVLYTETRDVTVDGRRVELTLREFELLKYLMEHPGATVSRGELLKEVWGYQSEEDPSRTVDTHIKTLRTKLGDTKDEPRFIRTIRGMGYRFSAGDGE